MLTATNISIDTSLFDGIATYNFENVKTAINEPTGSFFYDPWVLKEEFKNTIWEKLLHPLGNNIGEARIIKLENGTCYLKHADIDDRYHLNISGENSYLIDLDQRKMYETTIDGIWYEMDAGIPHTAMNAGGYPRLQLVVRKILQDNKIIDPVNVTVEGTEFDARYVFDEVYSPWLNRANKKGIISKFTYVGNKVKFVIEKKYADELMQVTPKNFKLDFKE